MENVEAMLCAYVEGDLDEAGRKEIEKHLAQNPQHRQMLEDLVKQRELLRRLPRVGAPGDVGDGLRGQMERSILLDSKESMPLPRGGRELRLSQVITAAAILLLGASLALILYRTVGPTFRPASYTQMAPGGAGGVKVPSDIEADIEASRAQEEMAAPEASSQPAGAAGAAPAQVAMAAPMAAFRAANLGANSGVAVTAAPSGAGLDWERIRRELKSSGYDVSREPAGRSEPLLLVVGAPDVNAIGQQLSQFLAGQSGVSWWSVPGGATGMVQQMAMQVTPVATATTQPTTRTVSGKATTQPSVRQAVAAGSAGAGAATQPSVRIYVACGLTNQQATELQESLSNQSADEAETVQVTQMPAQLLGVLAQDELAANVNRPTTQASAAMGGAPLTAGLVDAVVVIEPGNGVSLPVVLGEATTQATVAPTSRAATRP